jgi:CRISPR/Cas system-associated exonuclease Cas4 (RecB family)
MSQYYNPKRKNYLYTPSSLFPFRLSRSKIDLFLNCPRCFYFDRRLGVAQPPGYPFSLNSAVDKLLKKEFDIHRVNGTPHPLMKTYGVNAIPYQDKNMDKWRDALRGGIEYLHKETNLNITGGIDDIWVNPAGELIIVDYKATSKAGEVSLDADWQIGYKRQMEIYQWLFRKNNYKVSSTGYFVYCNGDADAKAFDGKLEFNIKLIPYKGDDSWIEGTIKDLYKCLNNSKLPESGVDCDYCKYREAIKEVESL